MKILDALVIFSCEILNIDKNKSKFFFFFISEVFSFLLLFLLGWGGLLRHENDEMIRLLQLGKLMKKKEKLWYKK